MSSIIFPANSTKKKAQRVGFPNIMCHQAIESEVVSNTKIPILLALIMVPVGSNQCQVICDTQLSTQLAICSPTRIVHNTLGTDTTQKLQCAQLIANTRFNAITVRMNILGLVQRLM
jgi:hypothetical protein